MNHGMIMIILIFRNPKYTLQVVLRHNPSSLLSQVNFVLHIIKIQEHFSKICKVYIFSIFSVGLRECSHIIVSSPLDDLCIDVWISVMII